MKVNVKFEVKDMHPGCGHKRSIVFEEFKEFETDNSAIIPDAGKHYVNLEKRFNGSSLRSFSKQRYEISYHIV